MCENLNRVRPLGMLIKNMLLSLPVTVVGAVGAAAISSKDSINPFRIGDHNA
jgi:hypothetical protein